MNTRIIIILCAFILLDFITGIIKAVSTGTLSSEMLRAGMWHKIAELIAAAFGGLCDYSLPYMSVQLPFSILNGLVIYIVFMEISSIIENLGIIFPDLGDGLKTVFEKVQGNDGQKK